MKEEVGCSVAPKKGGITSTSITVAKEVRSLLPTGAQATSGYRCLGVDVVGGRKRQQWLRASTKMGRFGILQKRPKQFKLFAKAVGGTSQEVDHDMLEASIGIRLLGLGNGRHRVAQAGQGGIHHASRNPTSPHRNSRSRVVCCRSWYEGAPLLLSHIFCPSPHFNPTKR